MTRKRFIVSGMFLALGLILVSGISPYVKLAAYEGPMNEAVGQMKTLLEEGGYEIIGQYQPSNVEDAMKNLFETD